MAKKDNQPTYSEAQTELEEILTEIESGDADVDELSAKVERASALIQVCRDKLTKTEFQVKKAVADLEESEPAEGHDETADA